MSWSDRGVAIGAITGSLRSPDLKAFSCLTIYAACWPANFGHNGLLLFPSTPWHAEQTAALDFPVSAFPTATVFEVTMLSVIQHAVRTHPFKFRSPVD